MAKYVCPSCGAPFDGKKCRNCAYESFSEEIVHNLHVHKGEPLVIKDTTRKQVPYKDPFSCPEPRRETKKSAKITGLPKALLIIFLIIFLMNVLTWLFAAIGDHADWPEPEPSAESVSLPLNGKTLFDDNRFTIIAQWQDGKSDSTYIPVYIINHTDKSYNFSSKNVTVNGFCLDDFSGLYAQVQPGETLESGLHFSDQGLQLANIAQIQQISFSLEATAFGKDYSVADFLDLGTFTLRGNAAADYIQSDMPGGQMLYSDETLTLSYVALWANDYDEKLEDMELVFCVENSSGNDLSIFDEQIQVNGEACDVSLWASVPANSKTLFTAYLYGIDLDRPEDIASFIMDLNVCPEDGDGYLIENISVPVNE